MPVRARAFALTALLLNGLLVVAATPAPASAASPKVAIIVGPVGGLTSTYRGYANEVASSATAAGATVVKAYSPSATWANVKAAVNGASVVVYFGHGNGYPNPYGSTELTDRSNGWGLNRTTSNGDADNWSTTMVYCGEKALLGTLTSSDGAAQWEYCGGRTNTDGITPAAGFTMVYGQAHYAPGFGERYKESDPLTTLSEAQQRVRHYSYPVLKLGARAYLATAYGDTDDIVSRVLTQPTATFGDIFRAGRGYSASTLTTMAHPDISGAQVWVQRTTIRDFHFGDPDYWYALAGNPTTTPSGSSEPVVPTAPVISSRSPEPVSTVPTSSVVSVTFDQPVTGLVPSSMYLRTAAGDPVAASLSYDHTARRAQLRPSALLADGVGYEVTLTSGIRSVDAGLALEPSSWSFTASGTAASGDGTTWYVPAERLAFRQGTHTGYRFDAFGRVTATRTVTLSRDSGASADRRATLPNQSGAWFAVVNGAWAGYWLRESPGVHLASAVASDDGTVLEVYSPHRRLVFRQGTHTGYRFSAAGAPIGELTGTLSRDSGADATVRRTLSNQWGTWFQISNGMWAGYWMRESDVIALP